MNVDKILLATRNKDKVREISNLLSDLSVTVLSIDDFPDIPEVVEDRDTLQDNAVKKAVELSQYFNMPALADDTGLEVDALNGAPGVLSARYAGKNATYSQNVDKLLADLLDVPDEKRTAQFRTVAAFAADGDVVSVEGVCKGVILHARRGHGGFGYDPVFYVPDVGKTFAEMTLEEKNKISHRGLALQKIKQLLKSKFGA